MLLTVELLVKLLVEQHVALVLRTMELALRIVELLVKLMPLTLELVLLTVELLVTLGCRPRSSRWSRSSRWCC